MLLPFLAVEPGWFTNTNLILVLLGASGGGAILAGVANWLVVRWKERLIFIQSQDQQRKKDEEDRNQSYMEVAKYWKQQCLEQDAEIKGLIDKLSERDTECREELAIVATDRGRLQEENGSLRTQLRMQEGALRQMRMGFWPGAMLTEGQPAQIFADAKGEVYQFDAWAAILLHWATEEIIGGNIRQLLARSAIPDFEARVAAVLKTGKTPDPNQTFPLTMRTREAAEIAVTACMSAWKVGNDWKFCLLVTRRFETPRSIDPMTPVPGPVDVRVVNTEPITVKPSEGIEE